MEPREACASAQLERGEIPSAPTVIVGGIRVRNARTVVVRDGFGHIGPSGDATGRHCGGENVASVLLVAGDKLG